MLESRNDPQYIFLWVAVVTDDVTEYSEVNDSYVTEYSKVNDSVLLILCSPNWPLCKKYDYKLILTHVFVYMC